MVHMSIYGNTYLSPTMLIVTNSTPQPLIECLYANCLFNISTEISHEPLLLNIPKAKSDAVPQSFSTPIFFFTVK